MSTAPSCDGASLAGVTFTVLVLAADEASSSSVRTQDNVLAALVGSLLVETNVTLCNAASNSAKLLPPPAAVIVSVGELQA